MGAIWFWIVSAMLTAYVVLDGFDIGVGVLHILLGKSEQERQTIIRTVGPVWDGNEVWLLAAGGTLFFAFPLLYASAFSGFYLALMIVLWLLVLRALGIEMRAHVGNRVWREFFDGCFALSSSLLAVFFGAALANVIRGVPLGADGYFFLPLWTDWNVGPNPGTLDWYTVIGGLVALVALAVHGDLYIALKTTNEIHERARSLFRVLWPALIVLSVVSLIATVVVRPSMLTNYRRYPVAFVVPLLVVLSLAGMFVFRARRREWSAFLCSCLYLFSMLVGAAVGLYPTMLPSSRDPSGDITIDRALTGSYAASVGLIWWAFGILLAIGYFVFVYRMFGGKVGNDESGSYGH